jgi:hypothetical protein
LPALSFDKREDAEKPLAKSGEPAVELLTQAVWRKVLVHPTVQAIAVCPGFL